MVHNITETITLSFFLSFKWVTQILYSVIILKMGQFRSTLTLVNVMHSSLRRDVLSALHNHLPVVDKTVLAKNREDIKSQFQLADALLRMDTP